MVIPVLEELLLEHTDRPDCQIIRSAPMAGVETLDFDCPVPPVFPVQGQAGRFETLLCQGGGLQVSFKNGQSITVHPRDILLLSHPGQLDSFRFSRARFRGLLVVVEGRAARGSLQTLCSLLNISLDTQQVGRLMADHQGCAVIRGTAWGEAVFSALDQLPRKDRGGYCTLKAVELLYLLCRRSSLLTKLPPAGYCDPRQLEVTRQVHDYMLSHLDERLTIQSLSAQFHLSSTALKSCFRQLYGRPLHQYLLAARMKRAEELLSTPSLSVLQVAGMVGYGSTSQFGSAFRRFCHTTPSQYRRQKKV